MTGSSDHEHPQLLRGHDSTRDGSGAGGFPGQTPRRTAAEIGKRRKDVQGIGQESKIGIVCSPKLQGIRIFLFLIPYTFTFWRKIFVFHYSGGRNDR